MAGKKEDAPAEQPKEAPKASSDDNIFGALCYILGIIVPLFVLFTEKKSNKFLAFHAWQSIALTVLAVAIIFGASIVITVLTIVSGGIASVLGCLLLPIDLVVFCAVLFTAYKAYLGEKYKLPIIGDFAEKQASK
jgi:uncharacterized membrane protein